MRRVGRRLRRPTRRTQVGRRGGREVSHSPVGGPTQRRSTPASVLVRNVRTLHDQKVMVELLLEYGTWLAEHREVTCFDDSILEKGLRGLQSEIRSLPRVVRRGRSAYFVAAMGPLPVGCVALRPIDATTGELTRLFVRPAARGRGISRILTSAVLRRATRLGYHRVLLDTLPTMAEAIGLYRSMGFQPTRAYWKNPVPGALFFEKRVRRGSHGILRCRPR